MANYDQKKKLVILGAGIFILLVSFQNCGEVKVLPAAQSLNSDPGLTSDGSGDDGSGGNDSGSGDSGSGDDGSGNNEQPGSYDNSDPYKCDYDDDGIVDFETKINGVDNTVRPFGYEQIQPQGLTMYEKTWESLFNGRAFEIPTSYLAPIGSWSVGNAAGDSMYITVPFVMTKSSYQKLAWRGAQSIPEAGYSVGIEGRRAEDVLVSVSPCAGDIRGKNTQSSAQWLKGCRTDGASQGSLFFSDSTNTNCRLKLNKTYWLTIQMKSCSNGPGTQCEANFGYDP